MPAAPGRAVDLAKEHAGHWKSPATSIREIARS